MLQAIAQNRNCIAKGGDLDYDKAALLIIDDYRNGVIGRMDLEFPEDYK